MNFNIYFCKKAGLYALAWLLGGFSFGQQPTNHSVSLKKEKASDILTPSPNVGWQSRIKDDSSDLNPAFENTTLYIVFKESVNPENFFISDGVALTGVSAIDQFNHAYRCIQIGKQFRGVTKRKNYEEDRSYIFNFESGIDVETAKQNYFSTGYFEDIELNQLIQLTGGLAGFVPNDVRYKRQWGFNNDSVTIRSSFPNAPIKLGADINMEDAWDCEQGDSNIVAVILDTGCNLDHPDLKDRLWSNTGEIANDNIDNDNNGYIDDIQGWDFRNNDNTPSDTDPFGHGTGISAIVGAEGNNGEGLTGVDLNCQLMIVKIVDTLLSNISVGSLDTAIRYGVDNGGNVINFSYTFPANSSIIRNSIQYAHDNEVVFVSITGNQGQLANNLYPGAYPDSVGVIVVGSSDPDDGRSHSFIVGGGSNFSNNIDVVAPGNYIQIPGNFNSTDYFWTGGTSASAAFVTGLAALIKAQDTTLSADSIIAIIRKTADDQVGRSTEDTQGFDIYHGHGRINAERALCLVNSISENNYISANIDLFPNPANGDTRAYINDISPKNVSVKIFDAQGRLVASQEEKSKREFDVHLPDENGVYFIEIIVNGQYRTSEKIIRIK